MDRLAAGFLLLLLAIGSLALWTVVPAGWLWLASKLTSSGSQHFLLGMLGTPLALALFGTALAWVNRLYMRIVTSGPPPELDPEEYEEWSKRRGPLESLLLGSLVIAAGAWIFWFFVLAEDPACCSGSIASIPFVN